MVGHRDGAAHGLERREAHAAGHVDRATFGLAHDGPGDVGTRIDPPWVLSSKGEVAGTVIVRLAQR